MKTGLLTFAFLLSTFTMACGYRFGYEFRSLPGGYDKVAIPVFQNTTQEVGVEAYFTNALVREFNRSQVARVAPEGVAPAYIEGVITGVSYQQGGVIDANRGDNILSLPSNTVLTTEYRVIVNSMVRLVRASDKKVIWQGNFTSERVYPAPQLGLAGINSANALYNHNVRHETLQRVALDMMSEAHDRMTEKF